MVSVICLNNVRAPYSHLGVLQHTVAAQFITAIYYTFIICVSAAHAVCEGSEEDDGWTVASRQHFSFQRMETYRNPLEIFYCPLCLLPCSACCFLSRGMMLISCNGSVTAL